MHGSFNDKGHQNDKIAAVVVLVLIKKSKSFKQQQPCHFSCHYGMAWNGEYHAFVMETGDFIIAMQWLAY